MKGERFGIATPNARSFPAFACVSTPGIVSDIDATLPPITCVCASALPLNGMWFILTPAADWNASIVRWLVEPLPSEANVISPGCAFAAATRSFSVLYGVGAPTTMHCGVRPMLPMSAKSCTGS